MPSSFRPRVLSCRLRVWLVLFQELVVAARLQTVHLDEVQGCEDFPVRIRTLQDSRPCPPTIRGFLMMRYAESVQVSMAADHTFVPPYIKIQPHPHPTIFSKLWKGNKISNAALLKARPENSRVVLYIRQVASRHDSSVMGKRSAPLRKALRTGTKRNWKQFLAIYLAKGDHVNLYLSDVFFSELPSGKVIVQQAAARHTLARSGQETWTASCKAQEVLVLRHFSKQKLK